MPGYWRRVPAAGTDPLLVAAVVFDFLHPYARSALTARRFLIGFTLVV